MIAHEEQRTIKWFLLAFYIILIGYDFFYYYFVPIFIGTKDKPGLPSNFWYINYLVLVILIPTIYYLFKVGRQSLVKYIFFIIYALTAFVVDIISFWGKIHYTSGNIAEVFLILSLPIFLNKKFFWFVTIGETLKYLLTGIILKTSVIIMPIVLILILATVSFFLLSRFQGYVQAISESYDKQLKGIVKGVIATLELKDPYTRGHSERVANYALMFATEIGRFTKEELKSFYYACLLHDIGKVHIPDPILMKPGKLTKEEYEIIKTHPSVGAEAVKDVEGIAGTLCVIRSHHERWDGKGYPDELRGEETPLLARITSIADAFDAMTSSRSYRAALPVDVAYQRVIEGMGTQFDPGLLEYFNKVFPDWVNFHENYPWTKKWELLKEVD